ncbi:MAG: PIN domain nuclease [bacterium]|nr:PIN domain nuclease [bacterium]
MAGNIEPVLLDTSVWIDAFRGKTPHIVAVTQGLLKVSLFTLDEHFSSIPGLKFYKPHAQ